MVIGSSASEAFAVGAEEELVEEASSGLLGLHLCYQSDITHQRTSSTRKEKREKRT